MEQLKTEVIEVKGEMKEGREQMNRIEEQMKEIKVLLMGKNSKLEEKGAEQLK